MAELKFRLDKKDIKSRHVFHKRGTIQKFSYASRLRMLRLMASIDPNVYSEPTKRYFVTITYGRHFPNNKTGEGRLQTKLHLDKLIHALRYHYHDICGVWRLELQKRGAPHYHFILFSEHELSFPWLVKEWAKIINWSTDELAIHPRCEIRPLKDIDHILAYVAKYCAKESSTDPPADCQVDENSRNMCQLMKMHPDSPAAPDDPPPQAGSPSSGAGGSERGQRFWGVINRAALTAGQCERFTLDIPTAILRSFTKSWLETRRGPGSCDWVDSCNTINIMQYGTEYRDALIDYYLDYKFHRDMAERTEPLEGLPLNTGGYASD